MSKLAEDMARLQQAPNVSEQMAKLDQMMAVGYDDYWKGRQPTKSPFADFRGLSTPRAQPVPAQPMPDLTQPLLEPTTQEKAPKTGSGWGIGETLKAFGKGAANFDENNEQRTAGMGIAWSDLQEDRLKHYIEERILRDEYGKEGRNIIYHGATGKAMLAHEGKPETALSALSLGLGGMRNRPKKEITPEQRARWQEDAARLDKFRSDVDARWTKFVEAAERGEIKLTGAAENDELFRKKGQSTDPKTLYEDFKRFERGDYQPVAGYRPKAGEMKLGDNEWAQEVGYNRRNERLLGWHEDAESRKNKSTYERGTPAYYMMMFGESAPDLALMMGGAGLARGGTGWVAARTAAGKAAEHAAERAAMRAAINAGVERTAAREMAAQAGKAAAQGVGRTAAANAGSLTGSAFIGEQVAAQAYADARASGLEPQAAAIYATWYGLAEAIPEKFALGKILRGNGTIRRQALRGMMAEAAQESVTQVLQNTADIKMLDRKMSLKEFLLSTLDAAVVGGLMGGTMGVVHGVAQKMGEAEQVNYADEWRRLVEAGLNGRQGGTAQDGTSPAPGGNPAPGDPTHPGGTPPINPNPAPQGQEAAPPQAGFGTVAAENGAPDVANDELQEDLNELTTAGAQPWAGWFSPDEIAAIARTDLEAALRISSAQRVLADPDVPESAKRQTVNDITSPADLVAGMRERFGDNIIGQEAAAQTATTPAQQQAAPQPADNPAPMNNPAVSPVADSTAPQANPAGQASNPAPDSAQQTVAGQQHIANRRSVAGMTAEARRQASQLGTTAFDARIDAMEAAYVAQEPTDPERAIQAFNAASDAISQDMIQYARANGYTAQRSNSPGGFDWVKPNQTTPTPQPPQNPAPPAPPPQNPAPANPAPNTPPAPPTTGGGQSTIRANGQEHGVTFEVREAASLSPATEAGTANQARNRASNAQSAAQVANIAANLDPVTLTADTHEMDTGMPTLARDGQTIIAGNGRTMAVQQAYAQHPERAQAYRQHLIDNAATYGLDPAAIAQMQNPVLVRRFTDDVDVQQMATASNAGTGMALSAYELAATDAQALPADLRNLVGGTDGMIDPATGTNAAVMGQWAQALPENRRNAVYTQDGRTLSREGLLAFRNAVLYRAYGEGVDMGDGIISRQTLADIIENSVEELRNVRNALVNIAPRVVDMKARVQQGLYPAELDISADLLRASESLTQTRKANGPTVESIINQQNLDGSSYPANAATILRYFNAHIRSGADIRSYLNGYYDWANAQQSTNTADIFGAAPPTAAQGLAEAARAVADGRQLGAAGQANIHYSTPPQAGGFGISIPAGWPQDEHAEFAHPSLYEQYRRQFGDDIVARLSHLQNLSTNPALPDETRVDALREQTAILNYFRNGGTRPDIPANPYAPPRKAPPPVNQATQQVATRDGTQHSNGNETLPPPQQRALPPGSQALPPGQTQTNTAQETAAQEQTAAPDYAEVRRLLERILGKRLAEKVTLSNTLPNGQPMPQEGAYLADGTLIINPDAIRAFEVDGVTVLKREQRIAWVAWHEFVHRGADYYRQVWGGKEWQTTLSKLRQNSALRHLAEAIQAERNAAYLNSGQDVRVTPEQAMEEALAELAAAIQQGNADALIARYGRFAPTTGRTKLQALLGKMADVIRRVLGRITKRQITQEELSDADAIGLLRDITALQGADDLADAQRMAGVTERQTPPAQAAERAVQRQERMAPVDGALYSFAGVRAETADHGALAQAQARVAHGENAEHVRQETGWHQGTDGKWRFEVADDRAKIRKNGVRKKNSTFGDVYRKTRFEMGSNFLEDFLEHKTLYAAYPRLRRAFVALETDPGLAGSYEAETNTIRLNGELSLDEALTTLLHEIQHVIQEQENFARGGHAAKLGYEDYQRLAGEVEARNTETRRQMDAHARRETAPQETQDVATAEQIIGEEMPAAAKLDESTDSAFANTVDKIAAGEEIDGFIRMGTTPEALQLAGLPDTRITMRAAVIKKAMNERLGDGYGHNLDAATLKRLPANINRPVAVMRSAKDSTNPDAYIVLTEQTETDSYSSEEKPVIAALMINESKHGLEVINITSVYGRSLSQIQRGLNSDLLYWDKEKGKQFVNAFRLQLPSHVRTDAALARANIKTNEDLTQEAGGAQTADNSGEMRYSTDPQQEFEATAQQYGGEAAYEQAKAAGQTELDYHQWVQVRTPSFKAWFGDWQNDPENASKVVNLKTGEPLVVYHGTNVQFDTFDTPLNMPRIFLTRSREFAQKYGRDAMPLFVNARNTLNVDYAGRGAFDEIEVNGETLYDIEELADHAWENGYDGVLADNVVDSGTRDAKQSINDEVIVTDSAQIKSATGNTGAFDPADANIYHSTAPETGDQTPDARQQRTLRLASNRILNIARAIQSGGKYISGEPIDFGTTPPVYQALGAEALPLKILNPRKLFSLLRPKSEQGQRGDNTHELTPELLAQVPQALQEPTLVFDSEQPGALVAVTSLQDSKGNPVVAAIHLSREAGFIRINKIASIYGKDNADSVFNRWQREGKLRYVDTKNPSLLTSDGVQFSQEKSAKEPGHTVLTDADVVKLQQQLTQTEAETKTGQALLGTNQNGEKFSIPPQLVTDPPTQAGLGKRIWQAFTDPTVRDLWFDRQGELDRILKADPNAEKVRNAFKMYNARVQHVLEGVPQTMIQDLGKALAAHYREAEKRIPALQNMKANKKVREQMFMEWLDGVGKYIYHGRERNAVILQRSKGKQTDGSGTDEAGIQEAERFFNSAEMGSGVLLTMYEDLYKNHLQPMMQMSDGYLRDAGLLTQEMEAARPAYQWYVPLFGAPQMEDSTIEKIVKDAAAAQRPNNGGASRTDVIRNRTHNAEGRHGTEAHNLFENIIAQMETAVRRAELQEPKRKLWAYLQTAEGARLFNATTSEYTINGGNRNTRGGRSWQKHTPDADEVVWQDGDTIHRMHIGNLRALEAIRDFNRQAFKYGANLLIDAGSWGLEQAGRVTRFMAGMYTRYNPSFVLRNKAMDSIQQWITLLADAPIGKETRAGVAGYADAIGNIASRLPVAAKAAAYNAAWTASGLWGRKGTDFAPWLERFARQGGVTTYSQYFGRDKLQSLQDIVWAETQGAKKWASLKHDFAALESMMTAINDHMELTTRVSAFRALVESGVSEEAAAVWAKDVMNFESKGDAGIRANALFPFFTTSLYDARRTFKALSKKEGQILFAALTGGFLALWQMLAAAGGEDDDGIAWVDKYPMSIAGRYAILPIPSDDGTMRGEGIRIPLGFGIARLANTLAVSTRRFTNGTDDGGRFASNLLNHGIISGFSPLQPSDVDISKDPAAWLVNTFSPQVVKPVVQLAMNKNYRGAPIYDDGSMRSPGELDYNSGYESTPDVYKNIVKKLYDVSGGSVDIAPETLQFLVSNTTGGAGQDVMGAIEVLLDQTGMGNKSTASWYKAAPVLGGFTQSVPSMDRERYQQNKEQTEHRYNQLVDAATRGKDYGKYQDAAYWHEYYKATEKQIRKLRKARKELRNSERLHGTDELRQRLRAIDGHILDIQKQANRAYKEWEKKNESTADHP